ncbi:DDE Tnp4 domain-containing protein [Mycena chlorophos]|uniref:DDE Tnp4 domain-containing protein n=1 Tax=Mycena chlorophos TaxID=658473 RepID=A0A8H6TJV4_MYCCL|nr:DDE Tnp4 domain-containing protein [Mycena chlorophos]
MRMDHRYARKHRTLFLVQRVPVKSGLRIDRYRYPQLKLGLLRSRTRRRVQTHTHPTPFLDRDHPHNHDHLHQRMRLLLVLARGQALLVKILMLLKVAKDLFPIPNPQTRPPAHPPLQTRASSSGIGRGAPLPSPQTRVPVRPPPQTQQPSAPGASAYSAAAARPPPLLQSLPQQTPSPRLAPASAVFFDARGNNVVHAQTQSQLHSDGSGPSVAMYNSAMRGRLMPPVQAAPGQQPPSTPIPSSSQTSSQSHAQPQTTKAPPAEYTRFLAYDTGIQRQIFLALKPEPRVALFVHITFEQAAGLFAALDHQAQSRLVQRINQQARLISHLDCADMGHLVDVLDKSNYEADSEEAEDARYLQQYGAIQRRIASLTSKRVCALPHEVDKEEQLTLVLEKYKSNNVPRFRRNLRVTPTTFDALLARIQDHAIFIGGEGSASQTSVEHQLAIALFRLGHFGNAASVESVAQWAGNCGGHSCERDSTRHDCRSWLFTTRPSVGQTRAQREEAKQWVEETTCAGWRNGWLFVDGL